MKYNRRLLVGVLGTLGVSLILCSCSAFESSRKMDMTPFSQNATTMYTEAVKISSPFPFKELKKYLDIPQIAELRGSAAPVIAGWKGLVMYSNQLVSLNNARLKESQKNQKLAQYILQAQKRAVSRGLLEKLGIEFEGVDTVISNIRSAPTFLEGIDAAAPLIDALVFALNSQIDSVSSLVPVIVVGIDQRIEADQVEQKRNFFALRDLQARYHYAISFLYRARSGEPQALDSLLLVDPSLKDYLSSKGGVSAKNWQESEDMLTSRLERIDRFLSQLWTEAQIYRARQQELQEWRVDVEQKIKTARDGLMVWAQSHYNLGKGIPVPPLIDVGGIAGGLAKKVVPLP